MADLSVGLAIFRNGIFYFFLTTVSTQAPPQKKIKKNPILFPTLVIPLDDEKTIGGREEPN